MTVPETAFVVWEDRYVLGIPEVDAQHKELFSLTNELYDACCQGSEIAQSEFRDVIHKAVKYVGYHFSSEEKLLADANYPKLAEHKKEHERFVKKVLEGVRDFENGRSFVPNTFVRFLRDWILEHIAVSDREYAEYLKKNNT